MASSFVAKDIDVKAVNTIKFLAVDGVEKAKSGHPGLPMGAADCAWILWDRFLKFNSADPTWHNRDRFILSGGHGSMLIYSLLHLFGYDISLSDLGNFRQWGSKTPGHPEFHLDRGIETTTGPLGQGITNAVGMAMAAKRMAGTFNKPGYDVIDHHVFAFCGDGDMMEGISHEACSLAGHLALDNLVVIYDDNEISIEGDTDLAFTENVGKRFEAYNWHVQCIDGHNHAEIAAAIAAAKVVNDKPSLIIAKTTIGKGAPNKAGTASAHGEPLGADEVKAAKELAGWPIDHPFYVPDEVYAECKARVAENVPAYDAWKVMFTDYAKKFPEMKTLWDAMFNKEIPKDLEDKLLAEFDCNKALATRASSGNVIQEISKLVPSFWGGSADLSPSNKSDIKGGGSYSKDNPTGKNLHFGVREHAMASILNGMSVYGGIIPYGATFMVFCDYLRPAMRLSAIMKQQVIYILTHDSIFVGEDGPTHEPIEHSASMRVIPNLTVIRPADTAETIVAWMTALENKTGPTALLLSRQNLACIDADSSKAKQLKKGAYIAYEPEKVDAIIIGTGSELNTALEAAKMLNLKGFGLRVVSMPSMELFDAQSSAYKESVLPKSITKRIVVEAASEFGWHKYVGIDGLILGMKSFGESAPYQVLAEKFGFTAEAVAEKTEAYLKS